MKNISKKTCSLLKLSIVIVLFNFLMVQSEFRTVLIQYPLHDSTLAKNETQPNKDISTLLNNTGKKLDTSLSNKHITLLLSHVDSNYANEISQILQKTISASKISNYNMSLQFKRLDLFGDRYVAIFSIDQSSKSFFETIQTLGTAFDDFFSKKFREQNQDHTSAGKGNRKIFYDIKTKQVVAERVIPATNEVHISFGVLKPETLLKPYETSFSNSQVIISPNRISNLQVETSTTTQKPHLYCEQ